jgi:hypothetical protein
LNEVKFCKYKVEIFGENVKEFVREYPLFSLCGLNCGLCPRYHTDGSSRCPGCGGEDFRLKHPACSIISCNQRHDNVEYCFQCSSYPCEKYMSTSERDSFITYKNVNLDLIKAKERGIEQYIKDLNEKVSILEFLLYNYNDGKRKNFYCLAVNLLTLQDLRDIEEEILIRISKMDIDIDKKIKQIVFLMKDAAAREGIKLELRK